MITINTLFIICISLVIYTYCGYGILLVVLVKLKRLLGYKIFSPIMPSDDSLPEVTLLICAYNEEAIIKEKIDNCNSLNYPNKKLNFLWVTDGSNDSTNSILSQFPKIRVIYNPERKGKTSAINHGMTEVKTPLVVFTDANTMLNEDAIRNIVIQFQDRKVGCVSGEKRVKSKSCKQVAANGEGLYWKYESALKKLDYELYSTMGAAGELFAIRKELYEELPENILLDDFIISMNILIKGYKIAYTKKAFAIEYGSVNLKEESKRKTRISAGGIQSIWMLKKLLNPFKYPIASFQYISHRLLRWSIAPIALVLLIPLNICLLTYSYTYIIIFMLQIIFYCLALYGYFQNKNNKKTKVVRIIYYFVFMNINIFRGMKYLYFKTDGKWEKAKRS
jgi:cellulose synthase/poly-beta-1,6-N-acetylglucosamine synthase-like glycosyltransferase